jgi:hypothetical protein
MLGGRKRGDYANPIDWAHQDARTTPGPGSAGILAWGRNGTLRSSPSISTL